MLLPIVTCRKLKGLSAAWRKLKGLSAGFKSRVGDSWLVLGVYNCFGFTCLGVFYASFLAVSGPIGFRAQ